LRPGAAYATTGDLYHTIDGGKHWTKVDVGKPAVSDPGYTALATEDTRVLAAGPVGIISGDVEKGWSQGRDRGWGGAPRQLLALGGATAGDGLRFAVTADGRLLRQQANRPWQPWGSDLPPGRITALASSSDDGNASNGLVFYIAVAGHGVCASEDGGQRCAPQPLAPQGVLPAGNTVHALLTNSAQHTVYAAVDGHGLYCSYDRGQTWQPAQGGKPFTITALTQVGQTIVAATQGQGVQLYSGNCSANGSAFAWYHTATGVPDVDLGLSIAQFDAYKVAPNLPGRCDAKGQICGAFWDLYQSVKPSTVLLGLPITPPVYDLGGGGRIVQYFERARLEYDPGSTPPVRLTPVGRLMAALRYRPACRAEDVWSQPARSFAQTGLSLAGPFLTFWQNHDGARAFGYPESPAHFEQNGDGTGRFYLVQYLDYARMEWHQEFEGSRYSVELGLLGREYLDAVWQTSGFAC
jgi:hypothetical protein